MTQKEQVMKHIVRAGSISAHEAILQYGITRLAARILELKKDGVSFRSERRHNPATGKQYTRYFLEEAV